MFLKWERVASDGSVKDIDDLSPHANATHVEIMADTQDVKYTMDDATDPTSSSGMTFLVTEPPKTFLIEDLRRIRFTEGAGGAGALNFHYFAGRNI